MAVAHAIRTAAIAQHTSIHQFSTLRGYVIHKHLTDEGIKCDVLLRDEIISSGITTLADAQRWATQHKASTLLFAQV